MEVLDVNYRWNGSLSSRNKTDAIVLHHRAGNGDVLSIHNGHVKNGWVGIGYHFYVRKDGSIYRGRGLDKMGAHAEGHNNHTIGICFEGNFENEEMGKEQFEAGRELINHIEECYGKRLAVYRHSDLMATACPGKNFPFDEMTKVSKDELVTRMHRDGVISRENVRNWELFLSGKVKTPYKYIRTIIERYQKLND